VRPIGQQRQAVSVQDLLALITVIVVEKVEEERVISRENFRDFHRKTGMPLVKDL
jgi:hypothetical protein